MAKTSSASWPTWFVVNREEKLSMIATVIGNIILGAETLGLGTLLSAMATLVQITFRQIISVVTFIINFNVSVSITLKQGKPLFEHIWGNICIIENGTKLMDIGRDRRHHTSSFIIQIDWKMRRVMKRKVFLRLDLVLRRRWEAWW